MKKTASKAQKPSEMGLHSKTRYVIYPQGNDRTEQMRDIIARAVYLFNAVACNKFIAANNAIKMVVNLFITLSPVFVNL